MRGSISFGLATIHRPGDARARGVRCSRPMPNDNDNDKDTAYDRRDAVLLEISKAVEALAKYVAAHPSDATTLTAAAAFFSSPAVGAALHASEGFYTARGK